MDDKVNAEEIERLIKDLNSPIYSRRARATNRLQDLGVRAKDGIRAAIEKVDNLEFLRRLELLAHDMSRTAASHKEVRDLRLIQALEAIGSTDVQHQLKRAAAEFGTLRGAAAASALLRIQQRTNQVDQR